MPEQPEIINIIQYWLDNIQFLPGFFRVRRATWNKPEYFGDSGRFNDWIIEDTLHVPSDLPFTSDAGDNYYRFHVTFNATRLECRWGFDINFCVNDPRFFEKLAWFLSSDWDSINHEFDHKVQCPFYCERKPKPNKKPWYTKFVVD